MKLTCAMLTVVAIVALDANAGTVVVDPNFQGVSRVEEVIQPGRFKVLPIGLLKAGDQIEIRVDAANKIYNDITVCIATEAEARSYSPRSQCNGQSRAKTPLTVQDRVAQDGSFYVVLDNSYAALIKKPLAVQIATRRTLSAEDAQRLKDGFLKTQSMMSAMFENSDFNIYVRPCGQSNAFSNNRTADITVCSEFIHEMNARRNAGALVAVLLHEYGHSLLNRWGEPGASEEDMADQFATALLLRSGDRGRELLQGWIGYWLQQDSRAEAAHQIQRGDTHTLSIQRARNIQNAMNFPEDFSRRWNKMLYRHMTREALSRLVAKPSKYDDLDLAQDAISRK
jgi:hypothetical protein